MVITTNIIRDSIYFVKNYLSGQITDPLSGNRGGESFILTSYPQKPVRYPVITIKDITSESMQPLGFQSQSFAHYITIEIRIWARSIAERDTITDQVYNKITNNQIGTSGTSQANGLHDLRILSMTNIDEPDGPKSKLIRVRYLYIT